MKFTDKVSLFVSYVYLLKQDLKYRKSGKFSKEFTTISFPWVLLAGGHSSEQK